MTSKDLEIFNDMPFFFWIKDEEGTYLWVNNALKAVVTEEIVGKKDSELPWVDDADALRANDIKVLETGNPIFTVEYVQKPDKYELNVCKYVGDFEGKRCAFGVSFVIDK